MIEIYGHPFSSFTWKALIAAYARDVPFAFRPMGPDQPENMARIAELSPTGQFPALVDGTREITGSNAVIAWLDRIGDASPLVPRDPVEAIEAAMMTDVFDDYVHVPMQRIVAECFRADADKDPFGVAGARQMLDRSYAWLSARIAGAWAIGDAFTTADCAAAPALFYADWVHPIPAGPLAEYRARLLAYPPVARVVDEARPYREWFPPGAPDRD